MTVAVASSNRKGGDESKDQTNQNRMAEAASLAPTWYEMTGDQKAAFLENVAQRLEKHGDVGGAQAARIWVLTVLEREIGFRPDSPRVDPAPNLPPRQMIDRLHELANWTWRSENRLYPSAGVLRDCCHYLKGVLTRELQQDRANEREGR